MILLRNVFAAALDNPNASACALIDDVNSGERLPVDVTTDEGRSPVPID